jgi:Holliday junction DNA helicase RuvA
MITRIEGRLVDVGKGRARIECGPLTYELLIPASDEQRLLARIDQTVAFQTLHYLEGQGQGSIFTPRLLGFSCEEDRAFFELFTTVKGVGNRKALRALALPFASIAEAIATKDVDLLKSLPEIGKRTAETIVAELHGKVDRFIELKPDAEAVSPELAAKSELVNDAIAVLTQLGEPTFPARHLVERALAADPTIDAADELVAAAFRLKEMH